jgi:hypothetical protein
MSEKKLEDIKGVFTRHQSKNDKQYNGQKKKDKLRSMKYYTEY